MLPRAIGITICCQRTWRHAPTRLRSPRTRGRATAIIAAAIGRMPTRPRRCASAPKVAGVCRTRARRATPAAGELCHRDHFTWARANRAERLGDGPAVRVVVSCVRVIAVWLVGVEVGQRRDGVWVWLELGGRVGCGGGCVSNGTSSAVHSGIEARPTRAVCWQGDAGVVCVELWPLYFLVCDRASTRGVIVVKTGKHETVIVITYPLPGKLPHKEADDTEHSNAAGNRKADDGRA